MPHQELKIKLYSDQPPLTIRASVQAINPAIDEQRRILSHTPNEDLPLLKRQNIIVLNNKTPGINCYEYALGTTTAAGPAIETLLTQSRSLRPGEKPKTRKGIVLYLNKEGMIKHAGLISPHNPDVVESQWGNSPVLQHPADRVPLSYGHTIIRLEVKNR